MKKRLLGGLMIFVWGLMVLSPGVQAQGGIKERFKSRLPVIKNLKAQGYIGEDNRGFLVFRSEPRPQQTVVQAENHDRQTVYEAIASKQGVTAEFVGKRRAKQIAATASSGEWLQDETGRWYQK